jgi:epoxide hydrolase
VAAPILINQDGIALLQKAAWNAGDLGGSNHLQGAKPQTVGFALADSPAGQAACIYEKVYSKTDNQGLAEETVSTDDMLNAISFYCYTNSCRVDRASTGRTSGPA